MPSRPAGWKLPWGSGRCLSSFLQSSTSRGRCGMDEGLFACSAAPRRPSSISPSVMFDRWQDVVWLLPFCSFFFFKVHRCFWLLRHLHRNYAALTLIFAIPTRCWYSTSALGPHTFLVFWGGVKEMITHSPVFFYIYKTKLHKTKSYHFVLSKAKRHVALTSFQGNVGKGVNCMEQLLLAGDCTDKWRKWHSIRIPNLGRCLL